MDNPWRVVSKRGVANNRYEKISVGPNCWLRAIVRGREDLKGAVAGTLYYIKAERQFAMIVGGQLLTGNIGHIYPPGSRDLVGVKMCRFKANCQRASCRFYHPGGQRNFTTDAWCYAPAADTHYRARNRRRIGAVQNLATDLSALTPADFDNLRAQTFHDILVMMVAFQN